MRKKLLIVDGAVVGTIEYGRAESCGYPISGEHVIVMNCVWILRKAKMHGFRRLIVEHMVRSERNADGFASIALENHWSPWFRKDQIERLGFRSVDSIDVVHKTKRRGHIFKVHLMWDANSRESQSSELGQKSSSMARFSAWLIRCIVPRSAREKSLRQNKRV